MAPLLIEVISWTAKYYEVHPDAVAFAAQIREDKAAVITKLYEQMDYKD
jgi:hypothetical protein